MSDAPKKEPAIKTPKQLIIAVIAGFLVPILCIILLVQYVSHGSKTGAGSDGQTDAAINARLQPLADQGFTFKDKNAPRKFLSGEKVYESTCAVCHASGVAGAPKFGDKAVWLPRIKLGQEHLFEDVIKGKGAMPAKGGNPDLDDIEVKRAVVYMANQAGATWVEPAEPTPDHTAETGENK